MIEQVTYRLDQFEGPLDLLLTLITKNKVSITDIPIALICDQYMEYIAEKLTAQMVSSAYGVSAEKISIISYSVVNSIKITFPRKHISGNLEDTDIYGCQQHVPLANIVL